MVQWRGREGGKGQSLQSYPLDRTYVRIILHTPNIQYPDKTLPKKDKI